MPEGSLTLLSRTESLFVRRVDRERVLEMDVLQKLDMVEIVARDDIDDERLVFELCESDSLRV